MKEQVLAVLRMIALIQIVVKREKIDSQHFILHQEIEKNLHSRLGFFLVSTYEGC